MMGVQIPGQGWRALPFPVSGLGLALLPKCPLCFAAILSGLGLSLPMTGPWLTLAVVLLAAVPALFLTRHAMRTGNWAPAWTGFVFALIALAGRLAGFPAPAIATICVLLGGICLRTLVVSARSVQSDISECHNSK